MKTAKDLMTKTPILIQSGSEIREQLKVFIHNDISSAPVVNPMGELLGSLNEIALIRSYLLHQIHREDNHDKVIHHKELLEPTVIVKESERAIDIIKLMIKSPNHRVVVVNNMKQVTGVISPRDILKFLAGDNAEGSFLKDELERTQQQLEVAKHEIESLQYLLDNYQHIYQDAPAMMHSVDANGKIIMANRKIHQILGYEEDELLGKTIFELYAKNCHGNATFGLKSIMDKGFHNSTYTTMLTKEGHKVRVDVTSTALRDKRGKFLGTISASRPVDSDSLLRALHGVLDKDSLEQSDLESLLSQDKKLNRKKG